MSQSAHRGELRRLIKEFVALENKDEISVDDISKFLLQDHARLVELEKKRLFHNSIADIARDVLKSSQASQQLSLPGFPEDAHLPARVPVRAKTKNGKPIWKKPFTLTGEEIQHRIEELDKPRNKRELRAMQFMMSELKQKLGENEGPRSKRSFDEVMGLAEKRKPAG
jgi:hypothetical protein